ncbi:MAG TPA: PhzF family phenazine biosynthesis protein [Bryobacteraceae bacterium]|nr:PhzF family phenazine biosynthesis protein [Bryobacteraceae bacterium]
MSLSIIQVDAFTNRPFAGNPAAVCVLPAPRDDAWMQKVALEMNLSETAFLVREGDRFHLRWFTPALEVALCGHATLASAHALWECGHLKPGEQARFRTLSGMLTADQRGEWIEMDFPLKADEPADAPPHLSEALGAELKYVGKNNFDYIAEVESEAVLRGLKPNHSLLSELGVRGVIVTARSETRDFDFVSRFFAPGSGINEDPVTGSAHCCLAPYWAKRLGKTEFLAYQASARGGVVRVRLNGDRVILGGQAVTVLRGELLD